jgi:cytochrome c oxidase cbb3-type subunit 3
MALRFAAVRNRGIAPLGLHASRRVGRAASSSALRLWTALQTTMTVPLAAAALAASALLAGLACQQAPAAESLREWTPADHHSNDDDKLAMRGQQRQAAPAPGGSRQGAKSGAASVDADQIAQLVEVTWRQQCSNCHGAGGHGDGQMGPMVHATDFTSAEWQSRATDADMATAIKLGKNRMPRFDLPDSVVAGLVARIRSLRAAP